MHTETFSIPTTLTGQYDFQQNAVDKSIEHATLWNIPADFLTKIAPFRTDYEVKYKVAANHYTQSPAATEARNHAWDAYEPVLRELYTKHLLHNDAISADFKLVLHINQHSGGYHTPTAPTTTPVVSLVAEEIGMLHTVYADSATPTHHSKPHGVAFLEINAVISDVEPKSPNECPLRFNISRNHEAIKFDMANRGKKLYGFARWVTSTGLYSQWSGVFFAIIP